MLDLQIIRDHPESVRKAIRDKHIGDEAIVDQVIQAEAERRRLTGELQDLKTEANESASRIGLLMQSGQREEAQALIARSAENKESIKKMEDAQREAQDTLDRLMLELPNIPHPSVPVGTSPDDNQVIFESDHRPSFDFEPLPHWDLIDKHELVDFERGSKVTGAGFPFYLGKGARLQRALVNFFLDRALEAGYTELQPPLVVNADSARGTGQLPDKEDQMYESTRDELYMIPTAEVPVTNLLRDEILDESDLPIRFCAYTPCFRREAGSHGKDVRGLNRLHQFDKVELVRFVHPAESYGALETMREEAESLLKAFGLPYRTLLMCTADMGFTQAKKYDLEVWSAGQKRWLEVSSISNFETFQARRMKIRYRPGDSGKPTILHTLNGSALAVPRIVAALLENNQRQDGSVRIPEVLVSYLGFDSIG